MEVLLKLWTGYLASGVEGIAAVLIAFAAIQAALGALVLLIKRGEGSVRLSDEDMQAILAIRMQYGLTSDNQAIIFAIRSIANQLQSKGEQGLKPETPNRLG